MNSNKAKRYFNSNTNQASKGLSLSQDLKDELSSDFQSESEGEHDYHGTGFSKQKDKQIKQSTLAEQQKGEKVSTVQIFDILERVQTPHRTDRAKSPSSNYQSRQTGNSNTPKPQQMSFFNRQPIKRSTFSKTIKPDETQDKGVTKARNLTLKQHKSKKISTGCLKQHMNTLEYKANTQLKFTIQKADLDDMSLVESEYMDIMEGTKPLRFVKIKDPCTKLTMVKLKDPKHPIKMYNDSKHQIIDLHKVINRGDGSEPDFGYHFKKLQFQESHELWRDMYNLLLGDPMQNKNLWDNVKKMNEIRKLYNQIVITKFRHLPKQIRRLPHIVKLFDQAKAMLDVIDAKNKEIKGTIKLAVSEIDNEKALNTEREEAFLRQIQISLRKDKKNEDPNSLMSLLSPEKSSQTSQSNSMDSLLSKSLNLSQSRLESNRSNSKRNSNVSKREEQKMNQVNHIPRVSLIKSQPPSVFLGKQFIKRPTLIGIPNSQQDLGQSSQQPSDLMETARLRFQEAFQNEVKIEKQTSKSPKPWSKAIGKQFSSSPRSKRAKSQSTKKAIAANDLVLNYNKYHQNSGISSLLETEFDHFARDFGRNLYNTLIKLDRFVKAEKDKQVNQQNQQLELFRKTMQEENKNFQLIRASTITRHNIKHKFEQDRQALTKLKPAMQTLKRLGFTNYKPGFKYLAEGRSSVETTNPMMANVKPKVETKNKISKAQIKIKNFLRQREQDKKHSSQNKYERKTPRTKLLEDEQNYPVNLAFNKAQQLEIHQQQRRQQRLKSLSKSFSVSKEKKLVKKLIKPQPRCMTKVVPYKPALSQTLEPGISEYTECVLSNQDYQQKSRYRYEIPMSNPLDELEIKQESLIQTLKSRHWIVSKSQQQSRKELKTSTTAFSDFEFINSDLQSVGKQRAQSGVQRNCSKVISSRLQSDYYHDSQVTSPSQVSFKTKRPATGMAKLRCSVSHFKMNPSLFSVQNQQLTDSSSLRYNDKVKQTLESFGETSRQFKKQSIQTFSNCDVLDRIMKIHAFTQNRNIKVKLKTEDLVQNDEL